MNFDLPGADLALDQTFLSKTDADQFFEIFKQLPFGQGQVNVAGREVNENRLTCFFGDKNGAHYSYAGKQNYVREWTPDLLRLKELVEDASGDEFNSCLINYYADGSKNIGWHSDSEKDLIPDHYIASVSLGAERYFDIKPREKPKDEAAKTQKQIRLELKHGSLLLMGGDMQKNYLHTVPIQKKVKGARINITFRHAKLG